MPMRANSLERYLDVAEDEVKAFQGSLVELKNYMELRMHLGSQGRASKWVRKVFIEFH